MTKFIVALSVLLISSLQGISQCDKKIRWNSTKMDMFDGKGTLIQSKAATIVVETDQQKISVLFKESTEDGLEGTLKEKTCDWKEAFRNGKTVYRAAINIDGKTSNAVFTLGAKDGEITMSVDIEILEGRKFLIYIDSYEEVK